MHSSSLISIISPSSPRSWKPHVEHLNHNNGLYHFNPFQRKSGNYNHWISVALNIQLKLTRKPTKHQIAIKVTVLFKPVGALVSAEHQVVLFCPARFQCTDRNQGNWPPVEKGAHGFQVPHCRCGGREAFLARQDQTILHVCTLDVWNGNPNASSNQSIITNYMLNWFAFFNPRIQTHVCHAGFC